MSYAMMIMGGMALSISELSVSFYPHPNTSDRSFIRLLIILIMSEELFTLSSNDYESRCKDTFSRLWTERDFADVTLATDDDFQISVHRIVLGSCSPLFKRLFSNTHQTHPIVFLQGISKKHLELVLEYIYQGKCHLHQNDLDAFLTTGRELQISDLTQEFVPSKGIDGASPGIIDTKEEANTLTTITDSYQPSSPIDLPVTTNEKVGLHQCKHCDYATRFLHNLTKHFNAKHTSQRHECTFCDSKYSQKQTLKEHIESTHEKKEKKSQCQQCDFNAASVNSLRVHTQNFHEGKRYYCPQCHYSAAHSMNLKSHIQIVHEGIRYECNECDFKTTTKKNLKAHIERIHKGIRYDCDECDYKTTRSSNMKAHKKTRHKNINPSIQS